MKPTKKNDAYEREALRSVLIHYFSGTGNTAFAVDSIMKDLTKNGIEVSAVYIGGDTPPSAEKADLHIIAFPVYSWSAPVHVKKYIRSLADQSVSRCALLSVGGARSSAGKGFGGQALAQLESLLRRKGWRVEMTEEIYLPENWVQFTNPPSPDEAKKIFIQAEHELQDFVPALIRGEMRFFKAGFFNIVWSRTIAFLYGIIGRRALGKLFIADDRCTACGVCVKNCPSGSISLKGYGRKLPQWDFQCLGCNRCMNTCPEKAIQMSAGRSMIALAAFVILILFIDDLILMMTGLLPFSISSSAASVSRWIAGLGIIVVFHVIYFTWFDRLLGILQQLPLFRRFFLLGWTKGFRRYIAPGYSLKKIQNNRNGQ